MSQALLRWVEEQGLTASRPYKCLTKAPHYARRARSQEQLAGSKLRRSTALSALAALTLASNRLAALSSRRLPSAIAPAENLTLDGVPPLPGQALRRCPPLHQIPQRRLCRLAPDPSGTARLLRASPIPFSCMASKCRAVPGLSWTFFEEPVSGGS